MKYFIRTNETFISSDGYPHLLPNDSCVFSTIELYGSNYIQNYKNEILQNDFTFYKSKTDYMLSTDLTVGLSITNVSIVDNYTTYLETINDYILLVNNKLVFIMDLIKSNVINDSSFICL